MHVQFKMKYIRAWRDHLGRQRFQLRRRVGGKWTFAELPVNGDPASPEFQAAYHAALRGERPGQAIAAVTARGGTGSVKDALEGYFNSATFRDDYSSSTQALRKSVLNGLGKLVGNLPLAGMDRAYVERWLEASASRSVKRTRLLAVRPFLQWATETVHLIECNPTDGIKVKTKESQGHHTWTDEEIEQFRTHHAIGTKARLALELLLAVAARLGDGIALGRQHVKDGWLIYTQEKNRKRKPVKVEVPIAPELARAIETCPAPAEALTFLTNEWGRPYSKHAFGGWFRKQVAAAGLPDHCVPHGLRKAACRIMAESDCTPHEIRAISGHRTLKEVERYTAAADNKRLAARAKAKVAAVPNVVPLAATR
jgi:integrase/recombinase XerD